MNILDSGAGNKQGSAILSMQDLDLYRKKVLLRLDINAPIDPISKRIVNENRLHKSLPTLRYLIEQEAAIAIIAHQGDTLDYRNLISLEEHANILSRLLGYPLQYLDDVAGPAAQAAVQALQPGEIICLGNLRYYTEEVSTFEDDVPLKAPQMQQTYVVRGLAKYFDAYVNDAFAAAHRNAPSMVGFQQLLPSAAGILFFQEISILRRIRQNPERPAVFMLGGAKISDAFCMMEESLLNNSADTIIVSGITGLVFLIAKGCNLGSVVDTFLRERSLENYIDQARVYLQDFPDRIICPIDLAYEENGERKTCAVQELPQDRAFPDIGEETIELFIDILIKAGTIFVNGPAGVFENPLWEEGTRRLWKALEQCPGYVVIGGGDSVSAAARFTNMEKIDYLCTAGGAMVRFLSGKSLPLISAMEEAGEHYRKTQTLRR